MTRSRKFQAPMTAEAFLAWSEAPSDDGRAELLDGRILEMVAERAGHAR